MIETILTPAREKRLVEIALQSGRELTAALWQCNLPCFFYVADVRGRIVDTRPVQKFSGLNGLVRTGQQEREYGR